MSVVSDIHCEPASGGSPRDDEAAAKIVRALREYFDVEFSLWDAGSGSLVAGPGGPAGSLGELSGIVSRVAGGRQSCLSDETGGVSVLALPVEVAPATTWVATAPFVTGALDARGAAWVNRLLDMDVADFPAWYGDQELWSRHALSKLAKVVVDRLRGDLEVQRLSREVDLVSQNLASTYEEISLLYAVTKNLRISSTDEELGRLAIEWLGECIPAEAFAILYFPVGGSQDSAYKARPQPLFITSGRPPVDQADFMRLVAAVQGDASAGPFISNQGLRDTEGAAFPGVRQLIAVPLVEGENVFGWLAVFNHSLGKAFGTVEANLIGSLGTLLGIHCGNRELYRQQSELLADIVRALVSAIDAKDPYTSGHSDRVARFAVRIALEMRCNPKFLNTIYMAGLLHDVGKIGIDDNVLRKTGRLTDVEFEHIKKHPELGFRILADLKPLADVLPAVLHHHEQWDGRGYPLGLSGGDIPLIARIMAVADAYDAMTSDRPYRKGMADEVVFEIFRDGAGKHWDEEVLAAFFRAKDDIRTISQHERNQVDALNQEFI